MQDDAPLQEQPGDDGPALPMAKRTLAGIAWVYAAFVVEKLSTLVTTAVLTRILVPEQFGIIASAMLVIGLLSTFRDLGVPESVIYFKDRPEETNNTSFWLHFAIGTTLSLLLFLTAPFIAGFLNDDKTLAPILQAMSPALLFGAFGFTHVALLQKHLMFARRASVDFLTAIFKAALTIFLAFKGWDVWAIVVGYVFGSIFRTAALWLAIPFRPRLLFSGERAREMLHYGKHIFGEGLVSNIVNYADQIAIVVLFGSETLAYYFVAARIPELVIYQIAIVLTTVLFPTISSFREKPGAIQQFVVEATRFLSYAIYPAALGLAVTAPALLETIFGSNWTASAPYVVILALRGLFATALWIVGDGLKAIGRPDKLFQITLIEACIAFPLTFILAIVFNSPLAACMGVPIAMLVANAQRLLEAKRLLAIEPSAFFLASWKSALAAIIMTGCVFAIEASLTSHAAFVRLAIEVVSGAAVYCAALLILERDRIKWY